MNLNPFRRRSSEPLDFDTWSQWLSALSPWSFSHQTYDGSQVEEIGVNFDALVSRAYQRNGVVFACELARLMLFSEARFSFRQLRSGRPGDLFGTDELRVLEEPWANGTTGDLLARMIQDADFGGNFFAARRPRVGGPRAQLKRMRPDWVSVIVGINGEPGSSDWDLDSEILGYVYHPGGRHSDRKPINLLARDVCHFAPVPDPTMPFLGMSWLEPIVREIMGDAAATEHKLRFFEQGATPNMVVSLDPSIKREAFEAWVEAFRDEHEGVTNAYKTLFLGAGAKVETVGATFEQMDFKVVQGAGETRIAAAAGVPPIVVGLSEGLASGTYANYGQALRRFADMTMRPLWRNACGSLSNLINVPSGAQLWYDDRDIPALKEDQKDAAEVLAQHAGAISTLVTAGFDPRSVVEAVEAGDLARLAHSGLFSVQLQGPGQPQPTPDPQLPPEQQKALGALLALALARASEE